MDEQGRSTFSEDQNGRILDRLARLKKVISQEQITNALIPFTGRADFESAWAHLLKVKSKGAPVVLRCGPSFWLSGKNAGVCIHTPPKGEAPIVDEKNAKGNWEQTIYIELIVDGEIIDLNRIQLPPDTPIIDERFKEPTSK